MVSISDVTSQTLFTFTGGGFQHMMVDINHARMRHVIARFLFAAKSKPFPYGDAGTLIAFHMGQEHVNRP
jgi:hypothetical protein